MKNLLIFIVLAFSLPLMAAPADFKWTIPIERESGGTLDPEHITGYVIYDVTDPEDPMVIAKPAATENSYTHELGAPGLYKFAITAVDQYGTESVMSEVVSKDTSRPLPPGTLKVVINLTPGASVTITNQ